MAEVALLGTGRMGSAMARRVADGGHGVRVWNRTGAPARALVGSLPGGTVAARQRRGGGRRGCCRRASRCWPTAPPPVRCCLDRPRCRSAAAGAVVVRPGDQRGRPPRGSARALAAAGVRFVDAPVSGSVPAVEAGTLLVMAGGRRRTRRRGRAGAAAFARRGRAGRRRGGRAGHEAGREPRGPRPQRRPGRGARPAPSARASTRETPTTSWPTAWWRRPSSATSGRPSSTLRRRRP